MFQSYQFTVKDRFMRYVRIDTQSDPDSKSYPSTEKQKNLGSLLVEELKQMGVMNAEMDLYGYVYAFIPSNSQKKIPAVCFCAHMDTAPDCSGTGVEPILHADYDGSDIILPDDPSQVIRISEHPYLKEKIGNDIITASGKTLLGADDKAGVAVIMDFAHFLQTNPDCIHGNISILFTPDEEIGRGVDKLDLHKLNADFAYTLDAGELGVYEDETFSADSVTLLFHGVSAHPGYAKDKMVNAIRAASFFIERLPRDEFSPESTEGRYGFVHPISMEGNAEKMTIRIIVRDFVTSKLPAYEQYLRDRLGETGKVFPGIKTEFQLHEQYRNMKEVLDLHPEVSAHAVKAIERAGLKVHLASARGGTDGSRLSFMGLPCPNLFTGEMAFHGKHEYVSVQDMQKSVETIVHLALIWAEAGIDTQ